MIEPKSRRPFPRRILAATIAAAYVSQLAVAGPPPGGGGDPPRYPDGTIVKTSAPISLPGGGGVSDGGGATYDLPLAVPAGPQGMQPMLSIDYAGRANGALGVGFGLSGLSVIAPCTKSIASEGYADGADFGVGEMAEEGFADSSPDSYCLDGQKLVPFGDPAFVLPSGGSSTTFHTETETFVHVVAHRANASDVQPDWFDVHARDGGVRRYVPIYGNQLTGVDALERLEAGAPIAIAYVIAESKDRNGNRITYTYDYSDAQDATEVAFKPVEIDYAFSNGTTPSRKIKLIYETRPDPIVRFIHGVRFVNRSRLDQIEAWAPNPTTLSRVWTYNLTYQTSGDTGRTLLSAVQMCDQFAVCSWTRSFEWTSTAHGPGVTEHVAVDPEFGASSLSYDQASLDWYNAIENHAANWLRPTDTRILVYDIDGDGDDDALYRTERTLIKSAAVYWSGFLDVFEYARIPGELNVRISSEAQPLDLMHYDVTDLLEPWWWNTSVSGASIELGKSRVADLDGDGLLDLIAARIQVDRTPAEEHDTQWTQDKWRYGYATYYGRKFDHFAEYPFDANQLGFDTVAMHGPVLSWDEISARMTVYHPPFQRIVADLDGDGRAEQIDSVDQDLDVEDYPGVDWDSPYDYNGGGFPYHTTLSSDGAPAVFDESWTCGNGHALVVDLDGDGKQEVLVAGDTKDDHPVLDAVTGSPGTYKRLAMSDPWSGAGTHGAAATTGTSALWAGDCTGEIPDLVMGDWNGDGLVDALYPPGSYGGNANPIVRWNLGNGTFGPNDSLPVTGAPGITALMGQPAPVGRQGIPVPWDRGTRVADVDGDGRSDIIAFRQDNAACVDPFIANPTAPPAWTCPQHVVVYRSQGDHFAGQDMFTWSDGQLSLAQGFTTAQIGDTNGDGAIDAISVAGGKLRVLELPWRQTPDLLERVRDTGSAYPVETFGYTRSWWGDHPRNEASATSPDGPSTCAWPISCPARGATVVRTHQVFEGTRTDGTAMFSNTYHKYASPRVSLIGRGMLGFGDHQIWDRERGAWTDRVIDNQTAVDPEPALPGGVFYPNAGAPSAILSVTPRLPAPTVAEITAPGIGPGLTSGMLIDVRVTSSSTGYDTRADASGRVLTVLPVYDASSEVDSQAAPDLSTMTPSYQAVSTGAGQYTTTTADYDDYGNATRRTTTIASMLGGAAQVTREVTATFDNRPDVWMLGLPTRTVTTAYDVDDTDHPGRVVRTDHDARGNTISIETNAIGRDYAACVAMTGDAHACEDKSNTVTLVYDASGNPTTTTTTAVDGIVPRIVSTTWDADRVYPVTTTDPLGFSATTLIHPALGVPIQVTDVDGVTTNATYDGFGRLVTATRPGASSLGRSYVEVINGNRHGLKTTDVRGDGQQSYEITDELGRVVDTAHLGFGGASWIYARQELDNFGQLARASNPSFLPFPTAWTTTAYDRLGQTLATTGPDSATTVTEPSLFATTSWDPEGHETYRLRDVAGRTIESGHHIVAGTPYGALHFTYGPFDQVEQITDALGNKTTTTRDPFGRVIDQVDPDTGETTSGYDGFGELVHQKRANGDTFDHTYDALGRLVVTAGPDGTTERFYDVGTGAAGKATRISSPDGVVTRMAYDTLGRIHTVAQTADGVTRSIGRRYDSLGRLKNVFYPDVAGYDRFTIGYVYGADGFLRSIGDVSACHLSTSQDAVDPSCTPTILWQVTGRDAWLGLTGAKYGTTIPVTRGFDALTGRQNQLSTAGKTTTYGYDADGLLTSRVEPATNRNETFTYDDLHRLIDWTVQGPKVHETSPPPIDTKYDYDPIGNLISATGTTPFTGVFGWSGRPHALKTSNVGGAYDYDKAGRQIHGGGRDITWSQFDLPDTITAGASARHFTYDGNGGRVTRDDASGTTTYLGRLYEHRQSTSGTSDVFYVDGEPGVVAQVEYAGLAKKVRYIVGDPLDSQSLVLKTTGVVDDQAYYDPFGGRVDANGQPTADPDPSTSRGFTGHEDDGGGLVNMQGRIYDRNQYRFLSPDPVVTAPLFGQSYNPYSYVLNSPLHFIDPSGFDEQTVDETVVTAAPPQQEFVYGVKEGTTTLRDGTEVQEISFVGGFRPISSDDGAAPPTVVVKPASAKKVIPNVEKKEPWQAPNVYKNVIAVSLHILTESDASFSDKLLAAATVPLLAPQAKDIALGNMIIAIPQAPVLSFDAYEGHHQRALAMEHNHADAAATDEWLAMAQEGTLGVGETAGLFAIFSPGGGAPAAAEAEAGPIATASRSSSWGRFFWDTRKYPSIRSAYSKANGGLKARGMSLHHWFFPQRWSVSNGGVIPDALVNGGWNLMELSGQTNSLMSPAIQMSGARGLFYGNLEMGIRIAVPSSFIGSAVLGGYAGYEAAE